MMKFLKTLFLICACVTLGVVGGLLFAKYCGVGIASGDDRYLIIVAGIFGGVCLVLAITLAVVMARAEKQRKNLSVNLQKNDIVLQAGIDYIVKKRGTVRPGEYTVLATDEKNKTFTLRVNDYVKEYSHNTALILSEGDRISARSSNVILR